MTVVHRKKANCGLTQYLALLVLVCALALLPVTVHATQEATASQTGVSDEKARSVETVHRVKTETGEIEYQATAGTLTLPAEGKGPKASVFFVSYAQTGVEAAARPITFAFNGGPGAASAYLHLGALGPKRVMLNDDGTIPAPPVRIEENPTSWLAFTDLVFVDPVGTGYSRSLDSEQDQNNPFWGVEQDARVVAEFIRLFLTQHDRWRSPKVLAGESYGGVRAATLAHMLQSADFGIDLSGIVFISPVLEYALTRPGQYNLLPWAITLPSYAASALHHGKLKPAESAANSLDAVLQNVEEFAFGTYLSSLARGGTDEKEHGKSLAEQVARWTGLSLELVKRHDSRVPLHVFARELLRDKGRIVGVYDTTVTMPDLEPSAPFYNADADPTLAGLAWPFTTAFTHYVRSDLGFQTDLPYRLLNDKLIEKWDWTTGVGSKQGFVTTAGGLKLALAINPSLRIFVAHGYYDLVTPYFATRFVFDQMQLPEPHRKNVSLRNYAGGHMMYTHREPREALFQDVTEFFNSTVAR